MSVTFLSKFYPIKHRKHGFFIVQESMFDTVYVRTNLDKYKTRTEYEQDKVMGELS